jgi:N-acetylneuraminate lyase
MRNFEGIFPALLTPFGKDGKINEKALEQLIEFNLKKGVAGFYACGSTAEAFMLSTEERKRILELVVSVTAGRAAVIAHVGAIGTDVGVELARHAENCGADMVSAVAPFYYKFSFDEIRGHYRAIAESVSIPMLVYNYPNLSGVKLSENDVAELLGSENFIGLKHTSSDFFQLERLVARFPDKLFYAGVDEMFLSGVVAGAQGGIGSTYNIMAEKFMKIMELAERGEIEAAHAVQGEVNAVLALLLKIGVRQGLKALLDMRGIPMGDCRPPFRKLTAEDRKLLETAAPPLLNGSVNMLGEDAKW